VLGALESRGTKPKRVKYFGTKYLILLARLNNEELVDFTTDPRQLFGL
jgi:hypothetical protein